MRALRQSIAAILYLAALVIVWTFCGPASAATLVKVGGYDFPPYVTDAKSGLAQELVALLNREQADYQFTFVMTSPQRRYQDMTAGAFDMIAFESLSWGWSGYPVHASKEFLDDSEIFVAKAEPGRDQRYFRTLSGKSILGRLGYHYAFAGFTTDPTVLKDRFHTELTTTHEGNILAVLAGRADLAIVTESYFRQFLKQHPDLNSKLLMSQTPDQVYHHAVVVRDGGPISAPQIDALIERLDKDGKLAALWRSAGIAE